MTLKVDVQHQQGAFSLDATFETSGGLTALFGPSGSGKTTLINLLSGLTKPSRGRIEVGGRVLVDTAEKIYAPPHKRNIGYVFQDARLFPHLSVSQNLRYGRFFANTRERYADMGAVVDMLGIAHLLDRKPAALSGGEKQRVAIGRALLASPKLILMDEPLAALDDARKREILPYIERLRDETRIPIVYVSHSINEVARLANDVVVLSGGKVVAQGPVRDVLARSDMSADEALAGPSALLTLEVVRPDDGFGLSLLRSAGGEWRLPHVNALEGDRLTVRIRARDVMIATQRPDHISALNAVEAIVTGIKALEGSQAVVTLDHAGTPLHALVTQRSVAQLQLAHGAPVHAIIKAVTFDAERNSGQ